MKWGSEGRFMFCTTPWIQKVPYILCILQRFWWKQFLYFLSPGPCHEDGMKGLAYINEIIPPADGDSLIPDNNWAHLNPPFTEDGFFSDLLILLMLLSCPTYPNDMPESSNPAQALKLGPSLQKYHEYCSLQLSWPKLIPNALLGSR